MSAELMAFDIRSKNKNKKSVDPYKEIKLIQKSSKSVCRCHHPQFSEGRCHYRTCRHTVGNHYGYGIGYSDPENVIIQVNEEYQNAVKELKTSNLRCGCGRTLLVSDLCQVQYPGDTEPWTYAHCSRCLYDLAAWKFKNRIWHKETDNNEEVKV